MRNGGKQRLLRTAKQLLYDGFMSPIQIAIASVDSQSALASRIGVKQQHVWNWVNRGDRIPAEHCVSIERVTSGTVMRWDLRPDDWHLIWPELIGADGAPAIEAKA